MSELIRDVPNEFKRVVVSFLTESHGARFFIKEIERTVKKSMTKLTMTNAHKPSPAGNNQTTAGCAAKRMLGVCRNQPVSLILVLAKIA